MWIVYTAEDGLKRIQLEILNVATGESRTLTDDNQVYLIRSSRQTVAAWPYVSTPHRSVQHLCEGDPRRQVAKQAGRANSR